VNPTGYCLATTKTTLTRQTPHSGAYSQTNHIATHKKGPSPDHGCLPACRDEQIRRLRKHDWSLILVRPDDVGTASVQKGPGQFASGNADTTCHTPSLVPPTQHVTFRLVDKREPGLVGLSALSRRRNFGGWCFQSGRRWASGSDTFSNRCRQSHPVFAENPGPLAFSAPYPSRVQLHFEGRPL
jgi:hypothetical protein